MTARTVLTEVDLLHDKELKSFYLETSLKEEGQEGFSLSLTDGASAWEGRVTEEMLDILSEKVKLDFISYVNQTKSALTQEKVGDNIYKYSLTSLGLNQALFVWKKHMVEEDVKFQLGSVKLQKVDQPAQKICCMMGRVISAMSALKSDIRDLQTDNCRLGGERTHALKRLEKCIKAKEELEIDLFSKFVAVLNSKKEKIRQLIADGPQALEDPDSPSQSPLKDGDRPKGDSSKGDSSKVDRKRSTEEESSEKEEEEKVLVKHRKLSPSQKTAAPKPSTSSRLQLPADTSLDLRDDDGDCDVMSSVARRPRRQASAKKATPAKPVLPRASSGGSDRSNSSSRRPSLQKRGSKTSHNSSDSLDTDDLLGNL